MSMNGCESTSDTMPSSPEASSPQQFPSGLSALIQAATSQLGHLAEVASSQLHDDCDNNLTPTIIREQQIPQRPLDFPGRLMRLCADPDNFDTITFLPDGKFFAIRQSSFQTKFLADVDGISVFTDFIQQTELWGFSRIGGNDDTEIVVFRHPNFVSGDLAKCQLIRYGESPESARMHALPSRLLSDATLLLLQPKRRLSPGFLSRRESASSVSSRQKVVEGIDVANDLPERKISSGGESEETTESSVAANAHNGTSALPLAPFTDDTDHFRSIALSITTDRLKISQQSPIDEDALLIVTAVTSCTHGIVTDAIESLLRDEGHSKETFFKHEKELSRSSLPGIVPVCKQLFAPMATTSSAKEFSKDSLPRVVTTGSRDGGGGSDDSKPSGTTIRTGKRPVKSPGAVCSDSDGAVVVAPVLQEASNSKQQPSNATTTSTSGETIKSAATATASSSFAT